MSIQDSKSSKVFTDKLNSLFSSNSHKFNAYKIQRNQLKEYHDEREYVLENKENQQPIQLPIPNKQLLQIPSKDIPTNQQELCEEIDDFQNIWNQIDDQTEDNNIERDAKSIEKQIDKADQNENNQNSSCELTSEELQAWMKICDKEQQINQDENQVKNINNQQSVVLPAEHTPNKKQESDSQNWNQWTDILNQLVIGELCNVGYNNKQMTKLPNKTEKQTNVQDQLVILDSPYEVQNEFEQVQDDKNSQVEATDIYFRLGPWNIDLKHYQMYYKSQPVLIQQLKIIDSYQQKSKSLLPIRKINWEIIQQRKPQVKSLKSKRNCRTNLLEYGRDFLVFDLPEFVKKPLKQGSHVYFGIKSFKDYQYFKYNNNKSINKQSIKNYLYSPSNGQCLLQTILSVFEGSQQKKQNKFDIKLSLNQETVAQCKKYVIEDSISSKECIEVRAFDSFQDTVGEYLAYIETKISRFSSQWYCDSMIHIPRKKVYTSKINNSDWQQLKIHLRLSDSGAIVAELGIFQAESSVTNCILFGENKNSQFMMGTLMENAEEVDYVIRASAISPIVAFATQISRQLFVLSD